MSRDLHHANFVHQFLNDTEKAIKMCDQSANMCLNTLRTVDEDTYREANHLVELLKENIAIWRGEDPTQVKMQ